MAKQIDLLKIVRTPMPDGSIVLTCPKARLAKIGPRCKLVAYCSKHDWTQSFRLVLKKSIGIDQFGEPVEDSENQDYLFIPIYCDGWELRNKSPIGVKWFQYWQIASGLGSHKNKERLYQRNGQSSMPVKESVQAYIDIEG